MCIYMRGFTTEKSLKNKWQKTKYRNAFNNQSKAVFILRDGSSWMEDLGHNNRQH